ncbi:MAG TPA: DUF3078 domain-containing protein [Bacteroidota bacterium]|nr:DUF3078 domain-containing protein [Bacteroidota bacterium]
MSKPISFAFLLLLICSSAFSQGADSTKSTPADTLWKHSLVAGLNLTQVSYTDWVAGGQNALAYTVVINGRSIYNGPTYNWDNIYNFAFGQTRLGDQGLRKTDDKIDLGTTLTYKVGSLFNPYANATLKSQFSTGYLYATPTGDSAVSKFFDPAFVTQSVGVGYQPIAEVKLRLGAALREIFTSQYTFYASDPPPAAPQSTRVDGGTEFDWDIAWNLDEHLLFSSSFQYFSPFKDPGQIVVRGDNTLSAKVSKYVVVSLNVQLISEPRILPQTQYKESLALGLNYSIF